MSSPLAQSLDLPIEYPTQEFGQHQKMIFLIDEIEGELTMGVNSGWSGYEAFNQILNYLEGALKTAGILPVINDFSVSELFGKLIIDLNEYGIDLVLTWPGIVFITGLVLRLKKRVYELVTATTPLPSNVEEKRSGSTE